VRCRDGSVVGVEALARWNHPTRGLLAPASFISLAEDSGLIVPLGKIVLDMASAQVAAWQKIPALEALTVSVNVSARQLRTADIVDDLRAALSESGLPAASLTLEVTESITADATAVVMLHELRNLGVRIALDDFGTGYSALSYLERLPLDVLKIDKGFVDDIHTQASRASLAGTIIRLGRSFGLTTVGEGVETPEQLLLLTELGCELVQGYLIARPAAPDVIEATLLELAGGLAGPQMSAADVDTVVLRIGPVASASATAWLVYATSLLDRVRESPSDHVAIPIGVFAAIDTYVKTWSETAASSDPFLWTGREDPSILRAMTHYWFQLAELRVNEAAITGEAETPPEGKPFNEALVAAILVALTVGADGDLEAEAIAWQRSWPSLPVDQSDPEPVPV
jgi:EAL domain-containing protein (putative c-di-GMP-specific phosphodiesterase class I)